MSKSISTGYDFQSSVDFQANQDIRAEDFKRLFSHQNFVGAHKGMRFGGISYDGTLTNGGVGRDDTEITLAGYFQRAIEDDGFILRADAYCSNITIDLDIYNVDNINTNINGANGFVATLTLNRSSGTLGWVNRSINLSPSDCTKDLTLNGEPALMEIRPTFSDNGGTWELGQLDVFEKIARTQQLVFRRTPLAFPEVQNDGTVEVSDAVTMNFGEGITATNPTGDTAKLVGPKNTNQSTSYDEIRFLDSGATTVTTSTTSITDDSGESGTRLDVTIDSTDTDTNTQDHVDIDVNGANVENDVDLLNVTDTDPVDLSATNPNSGEVNLNIDVNTGIINHNNLQNSSDQDAHHGAGTGLSLASNTMSVNDPLTLSTFDVTSELRDSAGAIDLSDAGTSAKGEMASFCTVYGVASGERFDTTALSTLYAENLTLSNYDSSNEILTVSFDNAYGDKDHYVPTIIPSTNVDWRLESEGTTSVDIQFTGPPGRFRVAIIGWDSNQV